MQITRANPEQFILNHIPKGMSKLSIQKDLEFVAC
jgi:hypothetical protein